MTGDIPHDTLGVLPVQDGRRGPAVPAPTMASDAKTPVVTLMKAL